MRVDPSAYDSMNPLANQVIVASGGEFSPFGGPWDLDFDFLGRLLVANNIGEWNLLRVDVTAYDPMNLFANQELVGSGGGFFETRGIAMGSDGVPIVTNQGGALPSLIRVDADNFDPMDEASNQTELTSNDLMSEPSGASVVGPGAIVGRSHTRHASAQRSPGCPSTAVDYRCRRSRSKGWP